MGRSFSNYVTQTPWTKGFTLVAFFLIFRLDWCVPWPQAHTLSNQRILPQGHRSKIRIFISINKGDRDTKPTTIAVMVRAKLAHLRLRLVCLPNFPLPPAVEAEGGRCTLPCGTGTTGADNNVGDNATTGNDGKDDPVRGCSGECPAFLQKARPLELPSSYTVNHSALLVVVAPS